VGRRVEGRVQKKIKPEISRKIGDATIHYASGKYKEVKRFGFQVFF
jgi:hypothetical protein